MGGIAGAVIGGIGSIVGGMMQADAAESAANTQAAAAREAAAEYKAAIEGKAIPALNDALALSKEVMAQQFGLAKIGTAGFSAAGMAGLDNYLSSLGITPPPGGTFVLQQALLKQNEYDQAFAKYQDSLKPVEFDGNLNSLFKHARNTLDKDTIGHGPNRRDDQRGVYEQALTYAGKITGEDYLSTEHVVGSTLQSAWDKLTNDSDKMEFLRLISTHIDDVPMRFYGGEGGQGDASALKSANIPKQPKKLDKPEDLNQQFKDMLDKYNKGEFYNVTTESLQRARQQFLNSPEYQLQFGSSGKAVDANLSPLERYETSPGYEFQVKEGVNTLQKHYAAKGLLESGPMIKTLQQFGQDMADTDYSNYMTRLTNTFSKYQSNLAGLTSMGAGFASGNAGLQYQYGSDISNLTMGNASNIASLYAGIGKQTASSIMAAGTAQAQGQMAAGQAYASGISGFGQSLAGAFSQMPTQSYQAPYVNPNPYGSIAFGNSPTLGAYAPSGFIF